MTLWSLPLGEKAQFSSLLAVLFFASAFVALGTGRLALCEHHLLRLQEAALLPGWCLSVNVQLPRPAFQVGLDVDGAPPNL